MAAGTSRTVPESRRRALALGGAALAATLFGPVAARAAPGDPIGIRPPPERPSAGVRPGGGGWDVRGPGRPGGVGAGGGPGGNPSPGAGPAGGGGGGPISAAGFANWLFELQIPQLTIRTNPDGPGLVGIETYFWVDGYGGEFTQSGRVERPAELGGDFTVQIRGWAGRVDWDFGDGLGRLGGSVGPGRGDRRVLPSAGPTGSTVKYVYSFTSWHHERAQLPGFPVVVRVSWNGRWTAGGGEGSGTLAAITRDYVLAYRVQEIQQILR